MIFVKVRLDHLFFFLPLWLHPIIFFLLAICVFNFLMVLRNLFKLIVNSNPLKVAQKMASVDTLQKLESKVLEAESIIKVLRAEVVELQKVSLWYKQHVNESKYEEVKLENEKLKKEIEVWKNRLIEAEKKNGVQPVKVEKDATPDEVKIKAEPVIKEEPVMPTESSEKLIEKKKKEKSKPSSSEEKKGDSKSSATAAAGDDLPVDVGRLDIRIGKIVQVQKHPDADSLYVEQVDIGEEKPRTVVSGLVKHVPIEEMQNRMVVLLCNLKPAKMRGVSSEAMVLCASTPEKVEILSPPEGSRPGDQVHVEGYPRVPDPVLNPKKKIFETVAPDLKTDNSKIATYKGVPFNVPGKGYVTAPSLTGVNIK